MNILSFIAKSYSANLLNFLSILILVCLSILLIQHANGGKLHARGKGRQCEEGFAKGKQAR